MLVQRSVNVAANANPGFLLSVSVHREGVRYSALNSNAITVTAVKHGLFLGIDHYLISCSVLETKAEMKCRLLIVKG